ncbi:MAG: hypothetical protein Q4C84_12295 [Bacillota bacterium]|nr:hypothetical protein [Bacillota bacterium]
MVNYDEFEILTPITRKRNKQVISIFENGNFAINTELAKELKTTKFEIRIKPDCTQILLMPEGDIAIDVGKSHRVKNYALVEKLSKKKIKFPIYYVGCADEKQNWVGELVIQNPNKHSGKVTK